MSDKLIVEAKDEKEAIYIITTQIKEVLNLITEPEEFIVVFGEYLFPINNTEKDDKIWIEKGEVKITSDILEKAFAKINFKEEFQKRIEHIPAKYLGFSVIRPFYIDFIDNQNEYVKGLVTDMGMVELFRTNGYPSSFFSVEEFIRHYCYPITKEEIAYVAKELRKAFVLFCENDVHPLYKKVLLKKNE